MTDGQAAAIALRAFWLSVTSSIRRVLALAEPRLPSSTRARGVTCVSAMKDVARVAGEVSMVAQAGWLDDVDAGHAGR